MAYQNFIEKLFTKNSTKQDFTWLPTQLTSLCKFQGKLLNFDPILTDMCIFQWPMTFVTRVFDFPLKKWIFLFC
jgi:hypothetical protein